MKNKHLVLIVLLTVMLGLVFRYVPFDAQRPVQLDLVQTSPEAVTRIQIKKQKPPEEFYIRVPTGWVYRSEGQLLAVPAGIVDSLITSICKLQSVDRIDRPNEDSLGLGSLAWQIRVESRNERPEQMVISPVFLDEEQAYSYVKLVRHQGVYRVNGDLRGLFAIDPQQFKNESPFEMEADEVNEFILTKASGDTLHYTLSDSLLAWKSTFSAAGVLQKEPVRKWLNYVFRLREQSELAPFFNELRAEERLLASLDLDSDTASVTLHIYGLDVPDVPEELRQLPEKPRPQACYVYSSSQNPENWFVVYDTTLVQRIIQDTLLLKPYGN